MLNSSYNIGTTDIVKGSKIKSLTREIGEHNISLKYASLEKELFESINQLNIEPAGFSGKTTALAVHMECCHTYRNS